MEFSVHCEIVRPTRLSNVKLQARATLAVARERNMRRDERRGKTTLEVPTVVFDHLTHTHVCLSGYSNHVMDKS